MAKMQVRLDSILLISLMAVLSPAVQAGPQSILDPYASIQPSSAKNESRATPSKKVAKTQSKKPASNLAQTTVNTDETGNLPPAATNTKVKTEKVGANATKAKTGSSTISSNPGFFAGVKEIQHGYVTSIKAAGHGVINGSKAAGSKVAAGTRGIYGGAAVVGHKVIQGPKNLASKTPLPFAKQPKQVKVTSNTLPTKQALPGKPLDQVNEPVAIKGKDKSVYEEKGNILTHSFSKLNFLHKNKKTQPANMTANNPNGLPH